MEGTLVVYAARDVLDPLGGIPRDRWDEAFSLYAECVTASVHRYYPKLAVDVRDGPFWGNSYPSDDWRICFDLDVLLKSARAQWDKLLGGQS